MTYSGIYLYQNTKHLFSENVIHSYFTNYLSSLSTLQDNAQSELCAYIMGYTAYIPVCNHMKNGRCTFIWQCSICIVPEPAYYMHLCKYPICAYFAPASGTGSGRFASWQDFGFNESIRNYRNKESKIKHNKIIIIIILWSYIKILWGVYFHYN